MTSPIGQQDRIAKLHSPLPEGTVAIHRFHGHEALSRHSTYSLDLYGTRASIDFDALLGRKIAIEIEIYKDPPRFFNGVITDAEWIGERDDYYYFRMTLRSWTWLLARTTDCRIFSDMSVTDIIAAVLGDHGFATHAFRTTATYPQLPYCVQYRESDYAFVSRLMEAFGLYFFFEHDRGDHVMVIADARSSHAPLPGGGTIPFRPIRDDHRIEEEYLTDLDRRRRFATGKVTLDDYDFERPNADLVAEEEAGSAYAEGALEAYDYPGRYVVEDEGRHLAKVRLEAAQARDRTRAAAGSALSLFPGALVTVRNHPDGAQNREYLVTSAEHVYEAETVRSGAMAPRETAHNGRYGLLPADHPFRAPQTTRKPVIPGAQTAKVVGDGEIDVDEYGRILVAFHWDRQDRRSCRIRVAQVWAGNGWGGMFIPRVGMEVIVQFLEGDPDRPIVTGCVYNGDNAVPWPLPRDKTIAGVKSRSSEDGSGSNEFVFDDTTGDELVRLHAERDLEATVENDERRTVGNDRTEDVGNDVTVAIGGNRSEEVGGDHDTLVMGTLSLEAYAQMRFKVGASTITLTPGSIEIAAPTVTVKGDALAQVEASGPTVVKGAVVLIN